jgi:hypothetical protein
MRETERVEAMGEEGVALIPLVMYLSWICVYFGIFLWKRDWNDELWIEDEEIRTRKWVIRDA